MHNQEECLLFLTSGEMVTGVDASTPFGQSAQTRDVHFLEMQTYSNRQSNIQKMVNAYRYQNLKVESF